MKERRDNYINDEDPAKKKFKSNNEEPPKACPLRKKGAPEE